MSTHPEPADSEPADLPIAEHRVIETSAGRAVGCSYQWNGGQYCSLNTPVGVVGCGIFDLAIADKFGMAFAIARGTPELPLRQPEDLLGAKIVGVSQAAAEMGIAVGMSGRESLDRMLAAHLARCGSGGRVSQFGDSPPAPQ